MPIDINLIRKEKGGDPEAVKKSCRDRFKDETIVDKVIEFDDAWRKSDYELGTLRMEFGKCNKDIGNRKKESKGQDKCEDLMKVSAEIKEKIELKIKETVELDN
jgi:seryl-tRNA synthetase